MRLTDRLIVLADRALRSTVGADLAAVRFTREVLNLLNHVAGEPVCSAEELEKRRLDRKRPLPPPPSAFRKKGQDPGAHV
jgi:hypothetical protein